MNPRQDKLFNVSLIALLAIYAILTQAAQLTGGFGIPRIELPIEPRQPAEVSGYTIQFTSLDGRQLNPAKSLEAHLDLLEIETAPQIKRLANRLGIAYVKGATDDLATLQAEFEQMVLEGAISAEYQLVLRVVNPVEKYNLESYVSEEIITSFQFAQGVADCTAAQTCP